MAFHSPIRSPKKGLTGSSKRGMEDNSEDPLTYDESRGTGGLARDFKKAIEKEVGKKVGVKKPDGNEIKNFLKVRPEPSTPSRPKNGTIIDCLTIDQLSSGNRHWSNLTVLLSPRSSAAPALPGGRSQWDIACSGQVHTNQYSHPQS